MKKTLIQDILWHSLSLDKIYKVLHSGQKGISEEEAERRLIEFGPNVLQQHRKDNLLKIIFRQINNPVVYLLLLSTFTALVLERFADALVVLAVVVLNTLIGCIQEYKSSQSIQALMQLIPNKCTLLRDQIFCTIAAKFIVPGDVIQLQTGDRVPADIRLIQVKNFACDESSLTGESIPSEKQIQEVDSSTIIPERKCMAYNGSLVTSGSAMGIVVATGNSTEFGKISTLLEEVVVPETPLTLTLKKSAKWITLFVILSGFGLFIGATFRGFPIFDALIASVALSVAAIPEGLPATITIASAIGIQRMAKRKAVIRHLLAVETLGSTTVICTDKTGTLTQNQMTVEAIWTPKQLFKVTGTGYTQDGKIIPSPKEDPAFTELMQAVILCNESILEKNQNSWTIHGDPTELAFLAAAKKHDLDIKEIRMQHPTIDTVPFDSILRIMATLHEIQGKTIYLKGAPEAILQRCSFQNHAQTQHQKTLIHDAIINLAKKGMRVLAVAKKQLEPDRLAIEDEDLIDGYEFLGLFAMIDPPRQEVAQAIKACQSASITVKMITGDHPLTASIIGEQLGLLQEGKVITGDQLSHLNPKDLEKTVKENHIFARVLPIDKLKIVEAIQNVGGIVAMTGDGVNDAPALKKANIGIAMGITGTAVAKEAADMVLTDDNFISIQAAVEEGRRVYDNLIKSLAFIFPTSLAQALVILISILFFPINGTDFILPILPIQVLWINLIVAVALAIPLAFESMEPEIMKRPPRKQDAPLFSPFILTRTFIVGIVMAIGTIGVFVYDFYFGNTANLPSKSQTICVTTLALFQIFYLFNCRSFKHSVFKIGFFSNPAILIGVATVVLLQLAFVHVPFMNTIFSSEPLSIKEWGISFAIAFLIIPIISIEKWLTKKII